MRLGIRLSLHEGGPDLRAQGVTSPNDVRWRVVESLEHGVLCRVFGLDPVRHRWDLPRSAHTGEGAAYAGRGSRVSGYLERHLGDRGWVPIGTLHVVREGERFRDLDVVDQRDQFTLDQTT